jgi:hypothetical protein
MEEEVCHYHYDHALWHIKKEGIREMKKYLFKRKNEKYRPMSERMYK